MRIGIDARELCGTPTGVGRYLGGLLREWAQSLDARRHEFVLYAPAELDAPLDARRFRTRIVPGSGGTWWEQVRLPTACAPDHLDAFFAPAYTAPLRLRVPVVATIHDVSFTAHPEWFTVREGARRRLVTRQSAARARAVITVSAFSRDEIVTRLGVPADRVHVVPPGIDPPPVPQLRGAAEPRVLYVGSIFNRRHVPALVHGFAALLRTHPAARLDIVGANRTHPREEIGRAIARLQLEGKATLHAYAPQPRLHQLYGAARAFAFLSEYEGFGLTPLEALAVGIPPVVLDTPVAREVLGEAAVFIETTRADDVARGLEQALFDEPTRLRILAAAPGVLARYDWGRTARATLAILDAAV
jgi:glycosyltransferase involved in cell wall biosynthesis